ncbi:2-dehydro-3-deoxy-6-phosphogalactonate aldolase [Lysobacter cavernae]|uniref:2-dehydro-3-deoxy-6-phosphogalactonate aldolase n=1 Tax=Lysobacter cavernae TaxID=1685901 RepID=A0ABV7RQP6_9GAMM
MTSTALAFHLPLIAILRGITPADVLDHVGALVEEGYDAIEIPLNSPDWQRSLAIAQQTFGTRAYLGAGTVLTQDDADAVAALGLRFIVTPNTNPALIRHASARGLAVIAGFATPSEAFAALAAGAPMLKLFPAATFGPGYVRALRAVLPAQTPLFAVGGIAPASIAGYLASGCSGAGLGGELYRAGQSIEQTRANARAFKQAYMEAIE